MRVTFEKELDNTKDITLYARGVGNESSSVEVFVEVFVGFAYITAPELENSTALSRVVPLNSGPGDSKRTRPPISIYPI